MAVETSVSNKMFIYVCRRRYPESGNTSVWFLFYLVSILSLVDSEEKQDDTEEDRTEETVGKYNNTVKSLTINVFLSDAEHFEMKNLV